MKYIINKRKLKEDIEIEYFAYVIAKCLALADFVIDEKIYEKLDKEEKEFFNLTNTK